MDKTIRKEFDKIWRELELIQKRIEKQKTHRRKREVTGPLGFKVPKFAMPKNLHG